MFTTTLLPRHPLARATLGTFLKSAYVAQKLLNSFTNFTLKVKIVFQRHMASGKEVKLHHY
jgi:hypothetical protein